MTKEELKKSIEPICNFISTLDLSDATTARANLERTFPISSLTSIREMCITGLEEGWLCPRTAPNLSYGRLVKASKEGDIGVDTVFMPGEEEPCKGPGHEHPQGEVDLCFGIAKEPLFDGNAEGWTVYPPKSWHVPTVQNGRMIILYFLPNGSIRFGPQ